VSAPLRELLTSARSSVRVRAAWCRLHLGALALVSAATWRPRWTVRGSPDTTPVTLLIHNAYGMGGTIRSTITEANQLAREGRAVRLVSVTRGRSQTRPFFALHPGVDLVLLDDPLDAEGGGGLFVVARRWLRRVPSVLVHPDEDRFSAMSLWTDLQLLRAVRAVHHGVLIGTRAALNVLVAHAARSGVVRVGQEHVPLSSYPDRLRAALRRSYPRLDALLVLTRADAVHARELVGDAATHVAVVPNALPDTAHRAATGDAKVVMTAGRFSRSKRHDLLIDAFARLAAELPDWELRIYGRGPREWRLRRQLAQVGLGQRIRLMGASDRLGEDLAEGSVFVLSSEREAFGIVLLEAMRSRLAVVSTASDHGPPEILTDGVDGLLTKVNDVDALVTAMRRVMQDTELRRRLGAAAQRTSQTYEPAAVQAVAEAAYRAGARVRRARLGKPPSAAADQVARANQEA
jgi:glycosyltransferase involved in cell wall biosynthesis